MLPKPFSLLLAVFVAVPFQKAAADPPREPLAIGTEPQFVFDLHTVDNYWALKIKRESWRRVFHPPQKHKGNPVIAGDGGYVSMLKDEKAGLLRLWYTTWIAGDPKPPGRYAIAYAESKDGIAWERPKLGLYEWKGTKDNNIVWTGLDGRRASSVFLLEVPEEARKGHRYVMLYREPGSMYLVGSADGIHWDKTSCFSIAKIASDTQNSMVYDPARREFVLYCRAKHIYRAGGEGITDTGESRRIARMSSPELWTQWKSEPQTILVPDEVDAKGVFNDFYGMPVRVYGGIYWGCLWPFKINTDIHTELTWSRDGSHFERMPERPRLIDRGPEGAWDHGMVFGSPQWVEMGDEWWFYYGGWDGPHEAQKRNAGIGLATVRKEGLIGMQAPLGGGVLATRQLVWPGGALLANASAREGEVTVRISDSRRKPLPGFGYDDCEPFRGDSVNHAVKWKDKDIASLAGQTVRLEIQARNAEIFTFRAGGKGD